MLPDDEPLIAARGLGRVYDLGETEVAALQDVDLQIGTGELVTVLGPSGSGKTTLLNLLGALDVASTGTVSIAGTTLSGASRAELSRFRRSTVSFVFQTFNLFPALTARENVQFAIDITHPDDSEAGEVLDRVGLGDRADHFAHQLSGGEQQRVAIARALATRNPVLLADEPTGELDYRTGIQILDLLEQQARLGVTVIVVTHNREIARVADRVVELSSGRIISDAPPAGGRVPARDLRW